MTEPIRMEHAHQIVAEVTGELSLAIERKKAPKAQMMRWIARMRMAADLFEAKMVIARPVSEPDQKCIVCNGSGMWECSPEEAGWRRTGAYTWITDTGLRVPANIQQMWLPCPCTERKTAP